MPLSDQDLVLIEKYFSHALSENEQVLFEQRMGDADFSSELDLNKQLFRAHVDMERDQLKKTFAQWDEDDQDTKVNKRPIRWWSLAAGFLLVIGFGLIWKLVINPSEINLYDQYYEPFANLIDPILKGDDQSNPSPAQLYELGHYQTLTQTSNLDSLERFYRALSFLETEQPQQTIEQIIPLIEIRQYRFSEAAEWYLGLAYLKMDSQGRAAEIFRRISEDPNHDYQQLAKTVFEKMR